MKKLLLRLVVACAISAIPLGALAQGANVAFGGADHDASAPVEVTADELSVDRNSGQAIFSGSVVAGQGDLRLSADRVRVEYATQNGQSTGRINQLVATGNVTLVNGAEAAEAQEAVYSVASSEIVMTGDVLLTQGPSALAGEKLIVDLQAGTGRMVGRVRTVFQPGGSE